MYPGMKRGSGLSVVLFLVVVACVPSQSTGTVQLFGSLQQAVSASEVTRMEVTVSGPDMTPRTETLTQTDGAWGGILGNLPAGSGRTFHAEAFDAANTLRFQGDAVGVSIAPSVTTIVAITLQEVSTPPPFDNAAPIIDSLVSSASTVAPGGSLQLQASAHDPDPSDTLSYAWTSSAGGFSSPSTPSSTWLAPSTLGPVTLTLTVTDSRGASTALAFTLSVEPQSGAASVRVTFNASPQVTGITASPSQVDQGETTTVSATVVDADGDTQGYQWTAGCAGNWENSTSATARFTPSSRPATDTCASCPLTITVNDGHGGQNTGTLHICVGPHVIASLPPRIDSTYQSATSVPSSGPVTLRVVASDPQAGALTFTWTANTGALGTPVSTSSRSEVAWTAPSCVPSQVTPSITATVTNSQGLTASASFTVAGAPTCAASGWASTGSMTMTRSSPILTVLPSGKVLALGGDLWTPFTELYDPAQGAWSSSAGYMPEAHSNATATLLPSGKVLVAGGYDSGGTVLTTAVLYDPVTGTWSHTGSMSQARTDHTATLLPSGKVLVVGGSTRTGPLKQAELYDPATSTWTPTGSIQTARYLHTATLLASGSVLIAGGFDSSYTFASAELYDPATGTWSSAGTMSSPRNSHTATLLPSGKVLIAGGYAGFDLDVFLATAELYDPATGTWSLTGSMAHPRGIDSAVLLSSGKVLVAGGYNSTELTQGSTEVYDPVAGTWSSSGSMAEPRYAHGAVRLQSGSVLVTGGYSATGNQLTTSELYTP